MFPASFQQPGAGYFRITPTGAYIVVLPPMAMAGSSGDLQLDIVATALYSGTWPTTINWVMPNGNTTNSIATYLASNTGRTSLKPSGTDSFYFWTRDAGATVFGKLI